MIAITATGDKGHGKKKKKKKEGYSSMVWAYSLGLVMDGATDALGMERTTATFNCEWISEGKQIPWGSSVTR